MRELVKSGLPVLTIDLGGTKILITLISPGGHLLAEERLKTPANRGKQIATEQLLSDIDRFLKVRGIVVSQLHSISIAAAGAIDSDKGLITLSPNLPDWNNIPLRDILCERYGVETFLINDASAAALGEHRFGAGRGTKNLVMLTVGTGIGGGIIIDGQLYLGASGAAGEVGHMTIDINGPKCACGNTGCLETLASGKAMAREALRRIRAGAKSSLVDMVDGKIESITAEKVGIAAGGGDVLSLDVIRQVSINLGIGMVNLVNIFNPEMIVVGGGVARMGELLLGTARRVVEARAFPIAAKVVRIITAQLGNDAGVYGAAVFAFERR